MIWYYVLMFITTLFTEVFSWLPKVTTLPTIGGIDVDASLSLGVGYFNAYINAFWPIYDLFQAVLFYIGYLVLKNIVMRFFLGHRAPHD